MKIVLKPLFILLLGISFVTTDVNAFEFHGLKSGMTREEVTISLGLELVATKISSENRSVEDIISRWLSFSYGVPSEDIERFSNMVFSRLYFSFDDRNQLWRLDVEFRTKKDPIGTVVVEKVLKEKFDEIKEEPQIGDHDYTQKWYRAILKDENLFMESVERLSAVYRSKM